ncbi:MAG: tetratricopeptide repeat protein [Rhizomicrobium sp.]
MPDSTNIAPQALKKIAIGLHQSGQAAAALSLYRQLLPGNTNDSHLHFLAGTAALQCGDAAGAETLLDTALALKPDLPLALANRATARMSLGKQALAEEDFNRALSLKPDFADAHFNRGNLYLAQQRHTEALSDYDRAIALRPDYIDALYNRACLQLSLGQPAAALAGFDHVLKLAPRHVGAHNNRGNAFRAQRRPEDALAAYRQVTALDPTGREGHYNCAIALTELARPEEALIECELTLKRYPDYAEAHCCHGNILRELGRLPEAIAAYTRAEVHKPGYADARWDRSMVELLQGDYTAGWAHFEERWRCALPPAAARGFTHPLWQGEPIAGKTILLHAEQGFGDTIQFCRYVPMVAASGARVLFEAPKPLLPLLATLKGDFTLLTQGGPAPLPDFDLHCPLMSLPAAFATRVETIPNHTPYLAADPARQAQWAAKLGPHTRARIGLVWSGRPGLVPDRTRSMALARLSPLLAEPYEFHALQKDIRPDDSALLSALPQLQIHCADLHDYADTAALIAELDLVITVDTSVAHLAGALHQPVWVILPFAPDWRWLTKRCDSPWYPSARIFRQARRGDWEGLVSDLIAALKEKF